MKQVIAHAAYATLYLSTTAPALAQSFEQKQRNAMNHIAQVVAATVACPEYEANMVMLALLGVHYKFDISDEKTNAVIVSLAREHRAGLEAAGKKVGCLAAWALYGPGGQNVPDLLRRK